MKHLNKILASAAVLLGFGWANAETVENYTVDFNTTISTTDHAFKVAPGWKHIVGGAEDWWGDITYVTYTYKADAGVDGSGALYIGAQSGTSTENYDYLVTPTITGTVFLQAQLTGSVNSAGLKVYVIDEAEDGTLTVGDLLLDETVAQSTTLTQDGYETLSLTGLNGQRIGIVGYYVNIDNFVVSGTAEIEYEKALTVTSATSSVPNSGSINCDADGNYSFTYTITVQNTGECDLAADDEGMFVGIANYLDLTNPVATAPIGQALAIGESATVEVSVTLNYADYGSRTRWDAIEGIGYTRYVVTPWVEPIPYLPNIIVRDADGHNLVDYPNYASLFGAFGMINESTTKTLQVRNTGAAPGEITITVPEGFTAEPTTFTVEAGSSTDVAVTMAADEIGIKSGDLVVSCGDDMIVTIALSGTVLDQSKWYVNFEDQQIPAGCIIEDNAWSVNTDSKSISDDNKRYLVSQSRNLKKFITPLLRVTEGEKMTVDVGSLTSYAADDILLNVYYSTDREEWNLLTTVASADLPRTTNSGYNRQYIPMTVVLEGIPAGDVYVAFEAGYVYIDNIYGFEPVAVDHDVLLTACNIPATAVANNDFTAKATLNNVLGDTEAPEYTATLYFDGEAVATAEAVEIPGGNTASFDFTFVPTEVGTHNAYVEFVWQDGYTVTSGVTEVTITAELAENAIIVGNTDPDNSAWNIGTQNYAVPICNYYKNGWSEMLYTPAMLTEAGLAEGDVISSITYMGYCPGTVTDAIKVYVISTEAETMATFEKTDVTDLTPVFDAEYTFTAVGSASEPVDLFTVNLPEPITWDGKSLRVVVASDRVSGSDTRSCFLTDTNIGGEIYQYRSDGTTTSNMVTSNFSKVNYFPVTKFGVQLTPSIYSGTVKDAEGNPLAGVTVTLTSRAEDVTGAPRRAATTGPVAYTATTDDEGKFSVEVVQTDKLYDATFTLDGYKPASVENISLANGNVELTEPIIMELDTPTAISDVNAATVVSVKYVNAAGAVSDRPFEGVNIVVTRRADGTVTTTKVVK
ncbi:MAG: carboxypeptidase regulatory-like domain-containing protein [Muribaculaceae bacterium]|nr:carboxypeptidase regulatory-like domain-containing protein [Muribaculaceae bacterium]